MTVFLSLRWISASDSFVLARFGSGFPLVFGFDESFQVVEVRHPEDAVLLNPRIDGAKWFRIELVNAMTPFPVLANQMRPPQQTQMFRNRWARDGKGAGNLSGGLAAAAQKIEHRSPRGVGQRLECGFGISGGLICNQTVTHNM
jgi:hypothetical protein